MGRRGRDDADRPGRREGGEGRQRDRHEGGRHAGGGPEERVGERQDQDMGYRDRVHERLDRMDARLERLEKRLEKLDGGGGT